jgi:hypothetical protein
MAAFDSEDVFDFSNAEDVAEFRKLYRQLPSVALDKQGHPISRHLEASFGSSGKFRQREGKPVGRKDEEPSLSWIWNQGLPVSPDAV